MIDHDDDKFDDGTNEFIELILVAIVLVGIVIVVSGVLP